jgi:hypothetical protein
MASRGNSWLPDLIGPPLIQEVDTDLPRQPRLSLVNLDVEVDEDYDPGNGDPKGRVIVTGHGITTEQADKLAALPLGFTGVNVVGDWTPEPDRMYVITGAGEFDCNLPEAGPLSVPMRSFGVVMTAAATVNFVPAATEAINGEAAMVLDEPWVMVILTALGENTWFISAGAHVP